MLRKPLLILCFLAACSLSFKDLAARSKSASGGSHSRFHKTSKFRKLRLHLRLFTAHRHSHFMEVDPKNFESEYNILADPDTLGHLYYSKVLNLEVDSAANINLYQKVQTWIGTPYLLGGDTHWGIDCSRFAGKIYNGTYNILLGSNCREIFRQVNPLDRSDLKEGDLVFFKIHSRSISHMGIYLGGSRFVHSSSSRGVIISSLDDPYYTRYFYKGGRISYLETASAPVN